MLRLSVLRAAMACTLLIMRPAPSQAGDNELQAELDKLGMGDSLGDMVARVTKQAMERRQDTSAEPQPSKPGHTTWNPDDWDDDNEIDYLAIRKQKDLFPKKGDAKRLTEKNFDDAIFNGQQEFTMVMFYSKWCKKCTFQAPSFRAAAKRYRDDPKVKMYVVNQEGNYDLSVRFDTDPSYPTIFYANNNPQIDGDLKEYQGEVSFAGLLQVIGSRGKDQIQVQKYVRPLYPDGQTKVYKGLNWDNFNETVFDKNKNVFIQFYAPWSEFCQNDAQNMTVLAWRLAKSNPDDVIVASINTDEHEQLADRFDITGLPAYWFANKSATKDTDLFKYTGDHNGALVMEEAIPFVNSQGAKVPPGMAHEHPIHPKPWAEIEKAMQERKQKTQEKADKEKAEQVARAEKRKETFAKKKERLAEKKEKKAEKKEKKAEKKDEL